jgi:hypothetical protein
MTGYNAAPTAGNIVWNLQQKCCQELPAILIEPLQCQQNASLSNPDSSLGTQKSRKEQGRVSRRVGHYHRFVFIQKGGILPMQMFNENLWRPLTAFLLKILDIVSSFGSSAGIVASSHMGSTLKVTKVSNLYKYFKYIFFLFWEFLCPPHICFRLCLIKACKAAKIWSTLKNKYVVQMVIFHLFMPV